MGARLRPLAEDTQVRVKRFNPLPLSTAKHQPDQRDKSKAATERQRQRALPTNSHLWRRIRHAQLLREPLCRHCQREGTIAPANEVDHIDGDSANNLDANLQSLCKRHHSRKTMQEGGRASYYPGWMPKPNCRLVVVWGPPAAGKSTYCKRSMKDGDILIDWDDIVREIAGHGRHAWTQREAAMTTRERNRRIAELRDAPAHVTAWIPTGAPTKRNRAWWESLGAEMIAVTPGKETLISRIMSDPERAAQAEKQIAAVDSFLARLEL